MTWPWTSELEARLTELWQDPRNTGEVLQALLGRSKGSILKRVRRMGLPYRRPHEGINEERLLALRAAGHSQGQCAAAMGLTLGQVAGKLNRLRKRGTLPAAAPKHAQKAPRERAPRRIFLARQLWLRRQESKR